MKYLVFDSLFDESHAKPLSEERLKIEFSYLDCSSFDELIKTLEESGYSVFPIVE